MLCQGYAIGQMCDFNSQKIIKGPQIFNTKRRVKMSLEIVNSGKVIPCNKDVINVYGYNGKKRMRGLGE